VASNAANVTLTGTARPCPVFVRSPRNANHVGAVVLDIGPREAEQFALAAARLQRGDNQRTQMLLGREQQPSLFVLAHHAAPSALLRQANDGPTVLMERRCRAVLLLAAPIQERAQTLHVPIQAGFASRSTRKHRPSVS
jgi:hypothetical protein